MSLQHWWHRVPQLKELKRRGKHSPNDIPNNIPKPTVTRIETLLGTCSHPGGFKGFNMIFCARRVQEKENDGKALQTRNLQTIFATQTHEGEKKGKKRGEKGQEKGGWNTRFCIRPLIVPPLFNIFPAESALHKKKAEFSGMGSILK
eukprot:Hpha_TRINITY_DN16953_c5_g2::TRINITY_DN16953_c5_g2_i1::g.52627::m.52627